MPRLRGLELANDVLIIREQVEQRRASAAAQRDRPPTIRPNSTVPMDLPAPHKPNTDCALRAPHDLASALQEGAFTHEHYEELGKPLVS